MFQPSPPVVIADSAYGVDFFIQNVLENCPPSYYSMLVQFDDISVASLDNLNKTTAERALFARYLVHIVGDIHQPLHSVAMFNESYKTGDRGGNSL